MVLNDNLEDVAHGNLWRREVPLILLEELSVGSAKLRCACGTDHMVNTGGTVDWALASLGRDRNVFRKVLARLPGSWSTVASHFVSCGSIFKCFYCVYILSLKMIDIDVTVLDFKHFVV